MLTPMTFSSETKDNAVLVTTEFRGVFFGYMDDATTAPDYLILTDARNCIHWSADCNGFLGLAATGITAGCKVGAKVPRITLFKITSITPVTEEAVKTWEKA